MTFFIEEYERQKEEYNTKKRIEEAGEEEEKKNMMLTFSHPSYHNRQKKTASMCKQLAQV